MKRVLIALEILIIIVIAAGLIFIYSGTYNIAASAGHYDFVRWVLATTMENSVRSHAAGIEAPNLERFERRQAMRHFDEMCVLCHGAPGVKPSAIGQGIVPEPPELSEVAPQWTPGELFWIVKNGIRMSGMPAFGLTHPDEDIWMMVAFIRQLPDITAEEYQAMTARLPRSAGHEHEQRQETAPASQSGGQMP
ncbi:MAG: cytochrome c [Desulfuromonadales bacterium]